MSRVLDTPSAPSRPAGERQRLPHLRLLDRREPLADVAGGEEPSPPPRGSSAPSAPDAPLRDRAGRVLVASADPRARARMLEELRSLLPDGTLFVEAEATWEVIARAPDSAMVVLAGDLGEVSAASLMRTLARRDPALPVLAVGEDRRARRLPADRSSDGERPRGTVDTLSA